jgi:hypothetical protein
MLPIASPHLNKQYLILSASLRCKTQCLVAGISSNPAMVFFPQYSSTSGASVTTAPHNLTSSNRARSTGWLSSSALNWLTICLVFRPTAIRYARKAFTSISLLKIATFSAFIALPVSSMGAFIWANQFSRFINCSLPATSMFMVTSSIRAR